MLIIDCGSMVILLLSLLHLLRKEGKQVEGFGGTRRRCWKSTRRERRQPILGVFQLPLWPFDFAEGDQWSMLSEKRRHGEVFGD